MSRTAQKRKAQDTLPENLLPIHKFCQLPEGDFGDVCGLIVDHRPIGSTKGLDLQQTIIIKDAHNGTDVSSDNVLPVKMFRREYKDLVPVERIGDVICFRQLKHSLYGRGHSGLASFDTNFVLFLHHGLPSTHLNHSHEIFNEYGKGNAIARERAHAPSIELQDYANSLGRRLRGPASNRAPQNSAATYPAHSTAGAWTNPQQQPATTSTRFGGHDSFWQTRYRPIKDVSQDAFSCTLIGEIVKLFDNPPYLDVYLTDYTSCEFLRDRSNEHNPYYGHHWTGPKGRLTLKIEVHEPTRSWMRMHMAEKSLVELRNVRCKWNQGASELEATMWADKRFPDTIFAVEPRQDDARVQTFLENKRQYMNQMMPENAFAALKDDGQSVDGNKESLSSKKKRKKKERLKVRQQEQMEALESVQNDVSNNSNHNQQGEQGQPVEGVRTSSRPGRDAPQANDNRSDNETINKCNEPDRSRTTSTQIQLNRRIVTSNNYSVSTLADILNNQTRKARVRFGDGQRAEFELPFINANFKMQLQVVDYEPKEVYEFVRANANNPMNGDSLHYEWAFKLLVIDANDKNSGKDHITRLAIPIHVDDEAAQYLFGVKARAVAMDEDEQKALAKAQEKFYALVGNTLPQSKEVSSKETSSHSSPTANSHSLSGFPFWQTQVNRKRTSSDALSMSQPFEACIREYGIRCEDADHDHDKLGGGPVWDRCSLGWRRVWALHSTRILDPEKVLFKRKPGEGKTAMTAIHVDSMSEEERMSE